ncbi:DoxX family protein [Pseudomethylobacillus aquaticus]|uniref:DoxX family protein n=1 Tax=Pseudomethylobacillus aquaticus TaxID=2676064 RepID=A0A3N0V2F0_9PROT|nr:MULTISPECIES: DoxX family protein [Methylophilaceae]ROH86987.1 DoxX family protein [Pseudomethylobacillus aquaticus]
MNKLLTVVARLLLAQLFLVHVCILLAQIMSHPAGYEQYQILLGQYGLPGIFAPLTILIQLLFGVLLLIGYKTKLAAYVLAGYAVFIAVALKLADPIVFMQYLAIAGGMLALALNPVTALSIDSCVCRKKA